MKKLILIRHGETDYTSQGKYCGHEDISLNAEGLKQAGILRQKLKNKRIDRIYSSDLKRALETAKIAFPERVVLATKGLREIDFGCFSGLGFKDIAGIYPDIYKTWLDNPLRAKIPNGEKMPDFVKRVKKCFRQIAAQNKNGVVAVVSHGGPIRLILIEISKKSIGDFWGIQVEPASINVIDF